METIYNVFSVLSFLAFLVMLAGLIRPSSFVPGKKRTRGRVLLYYGGGCFVLFVVAQGVLPEELREKHRQERIEREQERIKEEQKNYKKN